MPDAVSFVAAFTKFRFAPALNPSNAKLTDGKIAAAIKDALVRQAAAPVRWVESVQKMSTLGIARVIECGPGKVLSGLVKRIDTQMTADAINDQASLEAVLEASK